MDSRLAAFFFLSSLALYAATAAPSVATIFDDSLEFQVVLPTFGIAHPSGYPLYTILGWLFTHLLPFRDPAGRTNLLSALTAAAAVGILYLVARRLAASRWAAAVATAAFAISSAWWSQATIAEVYALHGLLVALFIYYLLRWEEALITKPRRSTKSTKHEFESGAEAPFRVVHAGRGATANENAPVPRITRIGTNSLLLRVIREIRGWIFRTDRWLILAALVFGLGLAHHRTIALLLPAALVFILWTDPALLRQPRRWLVPIALGLVPPLLYLYLPIRGQAIGSLDDTFVPTLRGTLDWITARGYNVFLTGNPFGVSREAGFFAELFLHQLGMPLVLAAGLGLATAWQLWPQRYALLLLATAAQLAFSIAYKVEDVVVFFIPAFMLSALWAALGLAYLIGRAIVFSAWLMRRWTFMWSWMWPWDLGALLLAALLLFQPIQGVVHAWPQLDRSRAWAVYDYGQDMLANVRPGGEVVGLLGETTLLRYFRDVLGQRPDVTVVPADAETTRFSAVDTALAIGVPVYLTRDLPGAADRYSLDAAGPLIAVGRKATPAPVPDGQVISPFEPPGSAGIALVDAWSEVRQMHTGPVVRLNLTWAASAPVEEELKVSARLLDETGRVVAQDDRVPVHFTYPTTAWVPGELVQDIYDLALSPAASGGTYGLLLILYRAADGGEVGRAQLPAVDVRR